ncbi:MAG: LemA family protein [Candidatus Peregrinibacteria bacterium]
MAAPFEAVGKTALKSFRGSPWLVLLGIVILIGLWVGMSYNGLVGQQEALKTAWGQVQTTYQRRVDLIPNLVAAVKGASNFEQSTLTAVIQARTQWLSAPSRQEQVLAGNNMESAIARLLVTVEAYPQLQATAAFRDLMTQLEGTENRIQVARRDYNDAVRTYNVAVRRFPTVIIAGMLGFPQEKNFEAAQGSEIAPKVDFGTETK